MVQNIFWALVVGFPAQSFQNRLKIALFAPSKLNPNQNDKDNPRRNPKKSN